MAFVCFPPSFGTVSYQAGCGLRASRPLWSTGACGGVGSPGRASVSGWRRRARCVRREWRALEGTRHPEGHASLLEELFAFRDVKADEAGRSAFWEKLEVLKRELDWRLFALDARRLQDLVQLVESWVSLDRLPAVLTWFQSCVHERISPKEREDLFWCLVQAWERVLLHCSARTLVQQLQQRPTGAITYSAVLAALSRQLRRAEAKDLWRSLVAQRIPVSSFALGCLFYAHMRAGELDQIPVLMGMMADHRCIPDLLALNVLLNSLGRMGQVREAFTLFRVLRTHGIANSSTYNSLLTLCRRWHFVSSALALKADMDRQTNVQPDATTYSLLMTLLASAERPLEMQTLYQEMRSKKMPLTGPALNAYIDLLYKRGKFEVVWSVYSESVRVCMDTLLPIDDGGCANAPSTTNDRERHLAHKAREAMTTSVGPSAEAHHHSVQRTDRQEDWTDLRRTALMHLNASTDTFVHIVLACTKSLLKPEAIQVYQDMRVCGHRLNGGSYNALIELCCRSADIARGLELFTEMRRLGLEPNATTYSLVIRDMATVVADVQRQLSHVIRPGIASDPIAVDAKVLQQRAHLLIRQALQFFADMRSRSYVPGRMVYRSLIRACAVTGYGKNLAELLISLETTTPPIEQLVAGELVESLLDQNHIETAQRFVERMTVLGLRLSVITCRALINALGRAKDANGVLRICSLMIEHGIEINHITLRIIERALMHHELPQGLPPDVGERAQILLQQLRSRK